MSFWISCMLFIFLSKYKQSLSQIVHGNKKAHASQHRQVSLYLFIKSAEYPGYYRFCYTIGYQVAYSNIYDKRQYLSPGFFFVLESKIFIQEITHNTAYNIIRGRRDPIIYRKDIIEDKHQTGSHQGIDDAHHQKFYRRDIKKIQYLFYHFSISCIFISLQI